MKLFSSSWCLVVGIVVVTGVTSFSVRPSGTGTRIHSLLHSTTAIATDNVGVEKTVIVENEFYSITSSPTGPADGLVHQLTFHHIPGQDDDTPMILETGRMGRLAAGAIELTRGDTVLYATASRDDDPKDDIDFLPLSVEHQERFSSAGLTSGAFNKRDGRPAEHEILTCRLIDRPIRPLIQAGWKHETQLLSWVLSYDGVRSCDPLAILNSAAALYLSDVPLHKPVAAVQVAMLNTTTDNDTTPQFVINPTNAQMDASALHLTVAGTKDAILMIEGAADFLPESIFVQAIQFGHKAIQVLCQGLYDFGQTAGKPKNTSTIATPPPNLQQRVDEVMTERVDEYYQLNGKKQVKGLAMKELYTAIQDELLPEFPEQSSFLKSALKDLLCRRMIHLAKTQGKRDDGRSFTDIRRLDMTAGFLPRVHGSALFTRGETQALATATLGDSGMRQKIDKISGMMEKRFYLQYSFPPSSVGETGRVGMPGRREVGHGNLAERALAPTLPTEEEFPYTIRVESLITESHGSSSMASVCGGCLALMDAGVPIKHPVAGIAMGMLLDESDNNDGTAQEDSAIVLSDITGTEDALGTMDFKVAGSREGITTFQLDIKCEGLTIETMEKALEQAREGRLHILEQMERALPAPRATLPDTVPKMACFQIPEDTIGRVIGPGGKQIRAIIEDFELENMDVGEDGTIQVTSYDTEKLKKAEEFVKALVEPKKREERPKYAGPEPVEGEIYTGKITGIHQFGVFVEIMPGAEDGSTPGLEGLVHVSELARERVRNCEGFMKSMGVEELTVKYLGTKNGKVSLSRKAVLEDQFGGGDGGGGGGGGGGNNGTNRSRGPPKEKTEKPSMSKAELDVIAQAIDGVGDL